MKSETVNVYSVFRILDSLVGTKVEGEIREVVAKRSVERTERQAGPETVADWFRIAIAFEETADEISETPFEASVNMLAAKIARKRAEAITSI